MRLAIFLSLALALSAPALAKKKPSIPYVGPGASSIESPAQATLLGHVKNAYAPFGKSTSFLITCLDGVSTKKPGLFSAYGNTMEYPDTVFITPGRHYVAVLHTTGPWSLSKALWLDARAGDIYTFKFSSRRERLPDIAMPVWFGSIEIHNGSELYSASGPIQSAPNAIDGTKACP